MDSNKAFATKITNALMEFAKVYGAPPTVEEPKDMAVIVGIYARELSKHFTTSTIDAAITLAWTKTRKFPAVSDFFEGFGGNKEAAPMRLDTY